MSPYYQELRRIVGSSLILMPSVAAVVHNAKGELLLQQKSDMSWSLPAGAIEPSETPEEALSRELLEETGLVAGESHLLGAFAGQDFKFTYSNGDMVEYTVLLYYCSKIRSIAKPSDPETHALQYFSIDDFPGLALPYPMTMLYQINSAEHLPNQ